MRLRSFAIAASTLVLLAAAGCARRCCPEPCPSGPVVAPMLLRGAPAPAPVAAAEKQVLLEMALVQVSEASLARGPLSALLVPGGARVVSASEGEGLLHGFEADGKVLQMPSIVAVAGQEASLFVGETGRPDETGFAVAHADWRGERVRVVATTSDPSALRLDLEFASRAASASSGPVGASETVRGAAKSDVPRGSSLVVVAPRTAGSSTRLVAFVKPTVLEPETPSGS